MTNRTCAKPERLLLDNSEADQSSLTITNIPNSKAERKLGHFLHSQFSSHHVEAAAPRSGLSFNFYF